jgi:cyclopropane fatty-acyl-phospholipid synthase-like methyltransferase
MTSSLPSTAGLSAAGFQDADAYDRLMGRWSRRLAPLLIGFGGLTDGERILDVGCGTGSLTFAFPTLANVAATPASIRPNPLSWRPVREPPTRGSPST